jgi:mannose-6-phosphate isomerase-like protein (cupin superfamily)
MVLSKKRKVRYSRLGSDPSPRVTGDCSAFEFTIGPGNGLHRSPPRVASSTHLTLALRYGSSGCPWHRTWTMDGSMKRHPVNLAEKLADIRDFWDPHVVGELNGQQVKLARIKGDFVWHHHQNEDELFLVLKGVLELKLRDGGVTLTPGEFFIVPRGVEHKPVAKEEVHLLMFEPASTLNTGNVRNDRTVEHPKHL